MIWFKILRNKWYVRCCLTKGLLVPITCPPLCSLGTRQYTTLPTVAELQESKDNTDDQEGRRSGTEGEGSGAKDTAV